MHSYIRWVRDIDREFEAAKTINGTIERDWIHAAGDGNDPPDGRWHEITLATAEHDLINGGGGADVIFGGAGNDRLIGGGGRDTLNGGEGYDAADYRTVVVPMTVNTHTGTVIIGGEATDTLVSIENITAGLADDLLLGDRSRNRLAGRGGDDTIYGYNARDELLGGDGNDLLIGGRGWDLLMGGKGDDIYQNPISDRYGIDTIIEAPDEGIDTILSDNSCSLLDYPNVERLDLTVNFDTFADSNLNGTGNNLDNFISGNPYNNILDGGLGNDTLNAGPGADTLIGGRGNDVMHGGTGPDVFRFGPANTGSDTIRDLDPSLDRFDLSGGVFTDLRIIGHDTRLFHDGGAILIRGVTGLSLDDWNALLVTATLAASGPSTDYIG